MSEAALPIKQGCDRMIREQREHLDGLEGCVNPAVLGSCRRVLNWQEAAFNACHGLDTDALTALADAGGVAKLVELLRAECSGRRPAETVTLLAVLDGKEAK